jgi:hypothetical protein
VLVGFGIAQGLRLVWILIQKNKYPAFSNEVALVLPLAPSFYRASYA